jgi:hypothetical protein
VRRGAKRIFADASVGYIADRFGHGGEGGWRLDPAHGAGEWDGHELFLPFVFREDDGQSEALGRGEAHLVEPVFEILLAAFGWPVSGVSMAREPQQSVECLAELHGFRWSVRDRCFVDGSPWPGPGVVAQQSGLAVSFLFGGHGGEH